MFSDFHCGFISSQSTTNLVVPDRVAGASNRSGATRTVALNICAAFHRVWHAGLLHKTQVWYLRLLCHFFVMTASSDSG